jgi:hypothetical protein
MEQPEHQTPIYKKALDIQKLVESLIELVRASDLPNADDLDIELINDKLSEMEENAFELPTLISEASLSTMPYDFRMENAVYIKNAASELLEDALYIEEMGLKDIDYLDLLYDEIEALRLLFIEWIETFELWKYDCEDWGLFTPDGIKLVLLKEENEEDFDPFEDDDEEDDD